MIATLLTSALLTLCAQQTPEDGRGQGLFDQAWHAGRRAALRDAFLAKAEDKSGVIVLRGQGPANDYREFRQDNNFWYFTGVSTPDAVYVLVPETGEEYFLVPRVEAMDERWQGDLIDPQEAAKLTGIAVCTKLDKDGAPMGNLEALLSKLAADRKSFYVERQPAENWMMSRDNLQGWAAAMANDPFDGRRERGEQFAAKLEERFAGSKARDVSQLIDTLRLVKTPQEIEAMREACRVTGIAHANAMRETAPGDFEWQIAARMTGDFLEAGAMGAAYLAIVGSNKNACMLHYPTNNRRTEAEDMVLIDYGAEYRYFVADVTRSWPLGKTFNKRHREVYEAVYDAQEAAFKLCKPGNTLGQVSGAAAQVIRERGFGDMWHGVSHWLGMATHDVGVYQIKLAPGMVFTVEPGIYLPDENFGVRIEDVVAITENGYDLLSGMIPRSVAEIEKLRAEARKRSKP
jgi:Xaa-Pro aminopeptidase